MPATEGSANRFSTGTLQLSKWSTCQTILMPKFFVRQVACPSWAPVASHENAWKWFWPLWHQSCGCSSGSGKTLHATKLDSSGWRLLGGPKGLCQENERNDLFLDLKLANLQIDFVLLKSPRPCCFGIRIPFPTDLGLYENTVAQMVRSIIIFHIDMAVRLGINCPCSDKPKYHVVGTYKCLYNIHIYIYSLYAGCTPLSHSIPIYLMAFSPLCRWCKNKQTTLFQVMSSFLILMGYWWAKAPQKDAVQNSSFLINLHKLSLVI